MKPSRLEIKLGSVLYFAIFILAVVLRFVHLGTFPLADEEALGALRAASSTTHASAFYIEPSSVIIQPAYEILTRTLFQIIGANDFLSRFIPALAGALLVLTPLLAKDKLGWGQTVIMGFLLAVCPVFVTISRTASGASLAALGAMSFMMGILGLSEQNHSRNSIMAGIGLGLCFASGPFIYTAIFILGISLIIWKLVASQFHKELWVNLYPVGNVGQVFWIAAAALFVFATGLGLSINGLSGLFDSLAYWLSSWRGGSAFGIMTFLVMIPLYIPVLLMLGILGGWTSLRKQDGIGASAVILALVGLFVVIFFPGHQPYDLVWIALPLSFVASRYLVWFSRYLFEGRINLWVVAMVALIVLFAFMMYLQFSSFSNQDQLIDPVAAWMTLLVFLALITVILSFFGLGWDWTSARLSVILASLILVGFLGIQGLMQLNFGPYMLTASGLWRNKVPSVGMELMLETIKTTSQMATGTDHEVDIEIIGAAPTSLIWALRDFQPSDRVSLDDKGSSVVLIRKSGTDLSLQDDYIGQTIAIGEEWGWDSALPPELLKWWVKRQPPVVLDEWLILVRQDISNLDEE
jgi:hypothetical protein